MKHRLKWTEYWQQQPFVSSIPKIFCSKHSARSAFLIDRLNPFKEAEFFPCHSAPLPIEILQTKIVAIIAKSWSAVFFTWFGYTELR